MPKFILHTFLSAPASTDMVYLKELERDVTTTAMAKELTRLKTLASNLFYSIRIPGFSIFILFGPFLQPDIIKHDVIGC